MLHNFLEFQISLSITPIQNFRTLVNSQALSVLLGTPILMMVPDFLVPIL